MANNALALRMKYRKLEAAELQAIIADENSSELEVKLATEFLEKMGDAAGKGVAKVAAKKTPKEKEEKEVVAAKKPAKKAPKKEAEKSEKEETVEKAAKSQVTEFESEEELTAEEKERLEKAEKEFEERQKSRKTPSKSDKAMKPATKEKKEKAVGAPRETKRQNLEESSEVPGLKIGSNVTLKEGGEVGEIVRVYVSGDGKEKCMVKFGENKPIKKRVTAVTLCEAAEETKKAPAKKKK